MDIKSKSNRVYKAFLLLIIFLASFSLITTCNIINNKNYLSKDYFTSSNFSNNMLNFFYKFRDFYYFDKNFNNEISKSEIDGLSSHYSRNLQNALAVIDSSYRDNSNMALEGNNSSHIQTLLEEKAKRTEEAIKENTKTIDELKVELVNQKTKEYNYQKEKIYKNNKILFYVRGKNQILYSNIDKADSINLSEYIYANSMYDIYFPLEASDNNFNNKNFSEISDFFKEEGAFAYFIVPKKNTDYSFITNDYYRFTSMKQRIILEICLAIASLTISLCLLIYLKKKNKLQLNTSRYFINKYYTLPLDLRLILFIIFTVFSLFIFIDVSHLYDNPFMFRYIFELVMIPISIFYLIDIFINAKKLIFDRKYLKQQISSLLCTSSFKKYINFIQENRTNKRLIISALVISILPGIIIYITIGTTLSVLNMWIPYKKIFIFSTIYIIVYLLTIPLYILKKFSFLNQIIIGIKQIISGNFNYIVEEKGSGMLPYLASSVNKLSSKFKNIDDDFKKAVEERLKSERLKYELITNVSHDLKTPLTSIINYVDLLKTPNLTKEEAESYISILDKKANRLKILIEDLFEASKLTSGNIELNIEDIDISSLLKQALAEFDEPIKNSSLIFKVNIPHHKILVNLDGKKTWRVFENLIVNILKYSLPNTRVYIDLLDDENEVKLTMKNISSYEMDFNVDEIFERFKRGDKSRTTEGSGLGLAIAKSIVELQGGTLDIEIDGDLFKAVIKFTKTKFTSMEVDN